ncbi:lytic transglycosylase domain-containing protein [Escherichia coli]|uniref:lytic transglycosylase domain-containing protein n=1 Tax=Escherichia coli TaxID=562 RepID=UPI000B42BE0B|nr:lytic transglycosylase domain-containing protein [Escherichia coli]ECW3261671.1 lytic transglycosylase domain-containing protein [Salmonella enterica]EFC0829565.1 lytic transglycosylase domain-containing protein [Escherichia coli]EGL2085332.1 lytic transglycosylase domain-containing protein [Escherichia coli]EGU4537056.1 lytic transglycosylase domain-containing protein [Salmonella enterica]EII6361901.1 lytic transglycosylase domain-containing protein [Escherichia coli]
MASLFPALLLCAASVHPDTINDIARVESGFNPYAVAEIIPERERGSYGKSVISHMPKSKEEALTVIREIENRKRRYSVGLMQITSSNFSFYSTSAEKLLDPCENLSVFEKIIEDCYKRGRSLENALSCYYTGNFSNGKRKEKEFNNTSYVERIGYTGNEKKYVVPGTRSNGGEQRKNRSHNASVIWPETILKSAFVDNSHPTKVIN